MAPQVSDITTTLRQTNFEDNSSLISLSRGDRGDIAQDTLKILKAGWYQPRKGRRIHLQDDIAYCNNNSILYTEYDLENTKKLITPNDEEDSTSLSSSTRSNTKIEIRHCTTLQAAQSLAAEIGENHVVGVLNFASAKNPGGGFLNGSQAQEESIARSSSLYLALTQDRFWNEFYGYHRRGKNGVYSHRIIYSPRAVIFKDDNGRLLSSPYHAGIVTVPAPNAGVMNDREASRNAMVERVKRLLHDFQSNKHENLILEAFGCDVFRNNPFDVVMIFRQHLESSEFKNSFKRIIFAIHNTEMCQIFEQVFTANDLTNLEQQNMPISVNTRNKQEKELRTQPKRTSNNGFKAVQDTIKDDYGDQEDDIE